MRKGELGRMDLLDAKTVAEEIVMDMYERGLIAQEVYTVAMDYAESKAADRILVYGDKIRDCITGEYRFAFSEVIERVGQ